MSLKKIKRIPHDTLMATPYELWKVIQAYVSKDLSIFGSTLLSDLENAFCKKFSIKYCMAVPNCTSAIYLALAALGLKPGDEVIIPNLTHPSTAYAASTLGLKIKLCDLEENSFNLDLSHLKKIVNRNTKAVIFCYLQGFPSNIEKVSTFCKKNNILLVEDVAQGCGISFPSGYSGSYGDASCFSFGENKTLAIGEGGMCCFKNEKPYKNALTIRHVGEFLKKKKVSTTISNGTYKEIIESGFDYTTFGFNFRAFPPIFAIAQNRLKKFDKSIMIRQKKAMIYYKILKNIPGCQFPLNPKNISSSAPIAFPVILPDDVDLNKLITKGVSLGLSLGKFYYPILSDIAVFSKNNKGKFINSKNIVKNMLLLPTYPILSIRNVKQTGKYIRHLLLEKDFDVEKIFLNSDVDFFDGFFLN